MIVIIAIDSINQIGTPYKKPFNWGFIANLRKEN